MKLAAEALVINAEDRKKAMWQFLKNVEIFFFLLICSAQDIREKKISVKILVLFGALFLIESFALEEISWEMRAQNMLPGIMAFMAAFLTKEQIGYGDAACLAVLGIVVSADILWSAIMSGLLLLSVCSMVLLLRKKVKRKTTLPFIPFLTVGMLWQTIFKVL